MESGVDSVPSVETRSFSEVEELDSANREAGWDLEYRQLVGGDFSACFAIRQCSTMLLMQERYGCSLEIQGQPPQGAVTVIVPRNPVKSTTLSGEKVIDGRMFMIPPGAEVNAVVLGGLEVDSFYLPKQLLRQAAGAFDLSLSPILADGVLRLDVDALRLWRLQQTFTALFSAAQDSVSSRELEASLALHIAELTADRQGGAVHCNISHPIAPAGAFNSAREYIEANLYAPLTMSDICAHAKIQIRSLQRLFLRKLDLTPTQYILARRMNSVRRQLIASEPEAGRVTDIAFRHGFNHPGRFAVQYRTFFGETPRQTLQNRPRP